MLILMKSIVISSTRWSGMSKSKQGSRGRLKSEQPFTLVGSLAAPLRNGCKKPRTSGLWKALERTTFQRHHTPNHVGPCLAPSHSSLVQAKSHACIAPSDLTEWSHNATRNVWSNGSKKNDGFTNNNHTFHLRRLRCSNYEMSDLAMADLPLPCGH